MKKAILTLFALLLVLSLLAACGSAAAPSDAEPAASTVSVPTEETEASAQELIHLIEVVEHHHLPAIFTETNGSVSAAAVISRETGTASFALDMAMGGEDYFAAMYHNIDTIREALG